MTKSESFKRKGLQGEIDYESLAAFLSYMLFGIIWYFVDDDLRKSDFTTFHVKQSINFIVILFILSFFNIVLGIIPIFNIIVHAVFVLCLGILFVVWFVAIIRVADGKAEYMPLIGKLADKYLWF